MGGVGEERRSLPPTFIMDALLQHLVNGLVLGGTYALLGIGLTLIFGLMNLVNFAHGELYTLGAYATFAALALGGLNFFAAVAVAIVLGAAVGAVCERVLLRPLRGESIDTTMLVMVGLWIALQNAELLTWGGVAKSIPHPFSTAPLTLGPVGIAPLRLFVMATAHSPAATALIWSVSPPCGLRARFATTPFAHASAFASPWCSIIAATSDRLYGCEPERTQTLPLSFGSASDA